MITWAFEDGHRVRLRHAVVHAVVERGGALLRIRRARHLLEGGKWGLPGGLLDRDETLTAAALRELREETGWERRVTGLLRINSRPDRPGSDRQDVAFDFVVEALRRVGEPDHASTAAVWVPIDRLPPLEEMAFDNGDTVRAYLVARGRPLSPPILL